MSNSTQGNDTRDWDYNRKADASSRQRTSMTKKVESETSKCQYERLSQTGPLSSGKD